MSTTIVSNNDALAITLIASLVALLSLIVVIMRFLVASRVSAILIS